MPTDVSLPPIWLLGSSGYSAELAAHVGAGFSFAHHFSDFDPVVAMQNYRNHFKPSDWRKTPYAILGVALICADTDAEADRLALSADLHFVRRAKGEFLPLASPEEAAAYDYSPMDKQRIKYNRARLIVGSPDTVKGRLSPLMEETGADEAMVTTMIYDHAARKRSYELLASAFGLAPPA
jgi:luciferase family oxidoreductase group 1